MLTEELRPKTWEDVIGQNENIELLKAIIKNKDEAPKVLIFAGDFGTGKTSCAKIFGKELNGKKPLEFDSSICGNVENMQKIVDGYLSHSGVSIFDEFQRTTKEAQSILLKSLEDFTIFKDYFIIFCTTEIERILPAIRSRSLEIIFKKVKREDLINHLKDISRKKNISLSDKAAEVIALHSGGHMRNAHMLLDKYMLLGENKFLETMMSGISLLCDYFIAVKNNEDDGIVTNLNKLSFLSLPQIKIEFEEFIWQLSNCFSGYEVSNEEVVEVHKLFSEDYFKIMKLYYSELFVNIFRSERDFQSGMLFLYKALS